LLQQREYGPLVTRATRARFLDFQLDVHDAVPGGAVSDVVRERLPLPRPAPAGTLLVAGACRGFYWSDGKFWHPIEQTPRTGGFLLDLRIASTPGTLDPVLSATDRRGSSVLWLRRLDDGRVRFEYEWMGRRGPPITEGITLEGVVIGERFGEAIPVPADGGLEISVRLDPAGYVSVTTAGHLLLSTIAPVADVPATVGHQSVTARGSADFGGDITSRDVPTPICDRVTSAGR
jgi:hypothetical protein